MESSGKFRRIIQKMTVEFVKVGVVLDFPPGAVKKVTVGGEEVLLANVGGKYYAIGSVCTHRGGPLDEGTLEGTTITCPWHGGKFDLVTGEVVSAPPARPEPSYEVKIEGSSVLLRRRM